MSQEKKVNVIHTDNINAKGHMLKVGRRKKMGRVEEV